MLKAKEDQFVFRKVVTLNPEVRYTLNVEEDVLLFRDPTKSSLSILQELDLLLSAYLSLKADMSTCENGGTSKKVGEYISLK